MKKKIGKGYNYMKSKVINFKLDKCCRIFPVRYGLLFTGYLDSIYAIISLVGLSDDSFKAVLMLIEEKLMDDNAKKFIPILTYATELSFSVMLLCAVYRRDEMLLRVYQMYCFACVILSIMTYSTVVAAMGISIGFLLAFSVVFQLYVILLVRSMIVEVKLEKRNLRLPTLVMSSKQNNVKQYKIEPYMDEIKIEHSESEEKGRFDRRVKCEKIGNVEVHSNEESNSEEEIKDHN